MIRYADYLVLAKTDLEDDLLNKLLEKTDDCILRSNTTFSRSMVLRGYSSPTRLEKVLLITTGVTVNLVFHFRVN